jgi:hypothetical protein
MQRNLVDDFQQQKDTLDITDKLKDRSFDNFTLIDKENSEEKKLLSDQVTQIQVIITRLQSEFDK